MVPLASSLNITSSSMPHINTYKTPSLSVKSAVPQEVPASSTGVLQWASKDSVWVDTTTDTWGLPVNTSTQRDFKELRCVQNVIID